MISETAQSKILHKASRLLVEMESPALMRRMVELLQTALLRAEEAYIDATENPPQIILVNPVSGTDHNTVD